MWAKILTGKINEGKEIMATIWFIMFGKKISRLRGQFVDHCALNLLLSCVCSKQFADKQFADKQRSRFMLLCTLSVTWSLLFWFSKLHQTMKEERNPTKYQTVDISKVWLCLSSSRRMSRNSHGLCCVHCSISKSPEMGASLSVPVFQCQFSNTSFTVTVFQYQFFSASLPVPVLQCQFFSCSVFSSNTGTSLPVPVF